MMKKFLISLSFLFLFLFHSSAKTLAQSSPAQAPSVAQSPSQNTAQTPAQSPAQSVVQAPSQAPAEIPLVQAPPRKAKPAATNVTKILEKAGNFGVFIRILKNTQVINQIENQLNTSNSLTILAPTNGAFSGLKAGTLNSLTTEQKVQLVQYHILPSFISLSNFQTLSNPVRTQASNTDEYPLNIITQGNWVNISTGLVNTSISGTVYADNQLAIYKVDRVLLPLGIFAPKPKPKAPAPAPTLAKPAKDSSASPPVALDASSAHGLILTSNGMVSSTGLAVILAVFSVGLV
ncbi:fasciclin-like arabinogalactan protein 12 [Morus notabilis]|uniref:fasciclin-like arabinogalactan protein 12 n=1 Tax=Morus notabilis TaxID=981085 RepID=UPI000CECEB49|nr:fasciclin-like arabinogalactan protein 12 [Morus notabilis]